MDEKFKDCPKECPLEKDIEWAREKACELIRKLEEENTRLKMQIKKIMEAFGSDDVPVLCPSDIGLNDASCQTASINCRQCWCDALETVGKAR